MGRSSQGTQSTAPAASTGRATVQRRPLTLIFSLQSITPPPDAGTAPSAPAPAAGAAPGPPAATALAPPAAAAPTPPEGAGPAPAAAPGAPPAARPRAASGPAAAAGPSAAPAPAVGPPGPAGAGPPAEGPPGAGAPSPRAAPGQRAPLADTDFFTIVVRPARPQETRRGFDFSPFDSLQSGTYPFHPLGARPPPADQPASGTTEFFLQLWELDIWESEDPRASFDQWYKRGEDDSTDHENDLI